MGKRVGVLMGGWGEERDISLKTGEAVVAALRRGQQRGLVDPALDVATACQLIIAMADGLCIHQALDPTLTAARFRPVLQLLLRRFLRPSAAGAAPVDWRLPD